MDLELLLNKDSSCSSHEIPTTRQSMPPDTAKNAAIAFEPDSGHVCEGKEQCASSPDEACEAAEPDAAAANLWCPGASVCYVCAHLCNATSSVMPSNLNLFFRGVRLRVHV